MAVLRSFLGVLKQSASPSFALPLFITIKKIIILYLFLGVASCHCGWHRHTLGTPVGYAPGQTVAIQLEAPIP